MHIRKPENAPGETASARFKEVFEQDPNTIHKISHSKRFLERWTADELFRKDILEDRLSLTDAQEACGCKIDVHTLLPVFHPDYRTLRADANSEFWHLTYVWNEHMARAIQVRDSIASLGSTRGQIPKYDLWRARNINRASIQLDVAAIGITHPPIAFEISSGCSVGCWFCGISATEFMGHATLQNGGADDWQAILEASREIFGDGMDCGFCYWATDPLDNPEYVEFLEIFEKVVGSIPQTTTAIPLRNLDLTRRVLNLWHDRKTTPNRFSVMTLRQLLEIHKQFTPEELYGVELVLQTGKEMAVKKYAAGRTFAKTGKKESFSEGTIACVTGFLVNIVEKTIRLVSPTMPSERWPDGYIVFSERTYADSAEYRSILKQMVFEDMQSSLIGAKPIGFVEGGDYDQSRNKIGLMFRRIELQNDFLEVVGSLIAERRHTPMEIALICVGKGIPLIQVVAELEKLWQEGVVENCSVNCDSTLEFRLAG